MRRPDHGLDSDADWHWHICSCGAAWEHRRENSWGNVNAHTCKECGQESWATASDTAAIAHIIETLR